MEFLPSSGIPDTTISEIMGGVLHKRERLKRKLETHPILSCILYLFMDSVTYALIPLSPTGQWSSVLPLRFSETDTTMIDC